MKKNITMKFVSLIIFLMTYMLTWAQPNNLEITMHIDFDVWKRNNSNTWYDAITFYDDDNDDNTAVNVNNGKKGKNFKSTVKNNQTIIWNDSIVNGVKSNVKKIVLINVVRHPENAGQDLLTQIWYDSENGGDTIEGKTRNSVGSGDEERYIISFAVYYGPGEGNYEYDIYTIDPIIRGSE